MAKHVQIQMNTCTTTYEYQTNCKLFKLKQINKEKYMENK